MEWMRQSARLLLSLGLLWICATVPDRAMAASGAYLFGEVITIRGCPNIIVVAERDGYSILRPVSGPAVVEQDILAGNLETIGEVTVSDVTRGNAQISAIVEDMLLTSSAYRTRIARFCK